MTLVKSISGIRGTIGGTIGEGLSPIDIVKFTTGYAEWLKRYRGKKDCTVVVGRDARLSGAMVSNIVIGTLMGCGCNVVNIGLATTPTTELAVTMEGADGAKKIKDMMNKMRSAPVKNIGEFKVLTFKDIDKLEGVF